MPKGEAGSLNDGPGKGQAKLVKELSTLVNLLEGNPVNVPLLQKQVALMKRLDMVEEALDAVEKLASLVMLSEGLWLEYLQSFVEQSPQPLTLERFLEIVERFEQAESDYLSLSVLKAHMSFILRCTGSFVDDDELLSLQEDVTAFLDRATVRDLLQTVVYRSDGLLSQSQELWRRYMEWELPQATFPEDLDTLHEIFLNRLKTPHSAVDETSSMYSSFCSEHCPDDYETLMVQATSASQSAKQKFSGEKRFGRTREDFELSLTSSPSVMVMPQYLDWELGTATKASRGFRGPTLDASLTRAVFERSIAAFASVAATTSDSASTSANGSESQAYDVEATFRAYKDAEADLWERYVLWEEDDAMKDRVCARAVRACPKVGQIWSTRLRQLEMQSPEQIVPVFEQAVLLSTLDRPADVAELFIARAGCGVRSGSDDVAALLVLGLNTIHKLDSKDHSANKLELFFLEWAEQLSPEHLDNVLSIIEKSSKAKMTHTLIIARSGVEARRGNITEAREAYTGVLHRNDLDWPEAVYDAYLRFENLHGDVTTFSEAQKSIKIEQRKLARRREKAAQTQAMQYAPMEVDAAATQVEAPVVQPIQVAPDATQSQRPTDDTNIQRDRENTTVLVTDLPSAVTTAQVEDIFSDCGHIRETTILGDGSALVEFRFADAVPRGLEKDRRKIEGREIKVSMLWRSTLFVTNFPRDTDDEQLRSLFSQYGKILQTRWPSRKYSDSRRFCYVTMESPMAAQEALVLHGMQMDGFGLTVLISDPGAKTKRNDTQSSPERTLFVGGLTGHTTQREVEEIFKERGTVVGVKLGWDPVKAICKGFAFVEMGSETEADACLALTGTPFKKKELKVEKVDPNFANKKKQGGNADKRARTVRLHNLPEGVQEGLLQQSLEKIIPVKRLEVFAKAQEAIAELETAADVGTLLLRTEPFEFHGSTITFSQQDRRAPPVEPKRPSAPSSALSFAPRNARKQVTRPRNPRVEPLARNGPAAEGQNSFRDFVQSTNSKRQEAAATSKETTGEKRSAEEEIQPDSKRTKTEGQ